MTAVSVIVPAFQAAPYVADAVRSALRQTLSDLEVIVVDDASTDATAEAAAQAGAGDPRLRIIKLPRNSGVSGARNTALQIARGTWVAPLDADDTFVPDRLARLVSAAECSGADLLADHVLLRLEGRLGAPLFELPRRELDAPMGAHRFIELDSPTLPLGFMKPLIRRAFIQQHRLRYPIGIATGEDFHFYVSCLLRGGRLLWMSDSGYIATERPGSLSRSGDDATYAAFERSTELLRETAERAGDARAVRALVRRSADLRSYGRYNRLSAALHERRFRAALPLLWSLSLQPYTWRRFWTAARRRLVPAGATP